MRLPVKMIRPVRRKRLLWQLNLRIRTKRFRQSFWADGQYLPTTRESLCLKK